MTKTTSTSAPVPCLGCGKDINQDYPQYVMSALAGICGTCESEVVAQGDLPEQKEGDSDGPNS